MPTRPTLHGSPPTTATSDSITLRVDDGRGGDSDVAIRFTVIPAPPAAGQGVGGPDWELLSPLDIIANAPVSYVVPGAVGSSLTYRVVGGLPAGLSFDPTTRLLTGSSSAVGFYSILLQATEAGGHSTDRTLSVRIRTAAISPAQTTRSDQPSAWRPADTSGLRSYLYYDGQGRVVGAVDEQQFLTETVYDIALKGSYFRRTIQDMLEGNDRMLGYTAAIDALTINEENRLKLKVSKLEKENEEETDRQIQGLIKKQEQLELLIQSPIDSGQLKSSSSFSGSSTTRL
jgi:hypothetical protein